MTAAMAIASPALAREGAVYFGGELGPMKANDTDIDVGAVEDAVRLDYEFDMPWDGLGDTGWDGSLLLGYDFGGFRLEGEGTMKKARIDSLTTSIPLPGTNPGTYPAVGHTDVMGFMLNAMGDFGDDDGVQAFVGGGIRPARDGLDAGISPAQGQADHHSLKPWWKSRACRGHTDKGWIQDVRQLWSFRVQGERQEAGLPN